MTDRLNFNRLRRRSRAALLGWVVAAVVMPTSAGCGMGGGPPMLDEQLAQSSLTAALDAWKEGQTPESLQQRAPKIVVGEPQWKSGQRLVSYQVLEPIGNDGSNLHVPVELELEGGDGARSKRQVTYTVGTSPAISVFLEEAQEEM